MTQNTVVILIAAGASLALSGCEIGPKKVTQNGYRGTGMNQVVNLSKVTPQQAIPANVYDTPDDSGPRASATYENVLVLGGVSTERFNHFMAQMNNWVAPQTGDPNNVGCNYCHNPNNMASDEKYPKVVARRMIQMTQNINTNWTSHVQQTGVTCWTCHRGNTIPLNRWSLDERPSNGTITGEKFEQNTPDPRVAFASLPHTGFAKYILNGDSMAARVNNKGIHPTADHRVSEKEAEYVYGFMMHMSSALGVNCTYCHNSGAFAQWNMSRPTRAVAWYGIQMAKQANGAYVQSVANVLPADQKGPHGDPYKINCATCHNGVYKPMYGVSMRPDNPVLWPATYVEGGDVAPMGMRAPAADPNATASSCNADFTKALTGKTIEFDTAKATIRSESTPLLDALVQIAGRCSAFKMAVGGHTDAVGNAAANQKLSEARAKAVDDYLVAHGLAAGQLSAQGFGATRPVDTSGTPQGNQRNRRIEIVVAASPGGRASGQ